MRSPSGTVLVVASLLTAGCGMLMPAGPLVQEHHSVERGAATRADVEIDMGAGDLEMKSGAKTLLDGDFEFNKPSLKPEIAYAVDGDTGALKVSQGSASGNFENNWRLSLDDATPIALDVTLGAGDAQLVLGRLNLQSLDVRLGAGDLRLDLRGMPAQSYRVNVTAGAGDTHIQLPASVGISAETSRIIGDVSISGLEQRNGRWVNPRAADSPVTIELDVTHAVGDLRISVE